MPSRWTLLALLLFGLLLACTPTRRGGGGGGGDDDDSAAGDDDDDVEDDDDAQPDDDDVQPDDDDVQPDDDDASSALYSGSSAGSITIAMMGLELPCAGEIELTWDGSWADGAMTCADTMYGLDCSVVIDAGAGLSLAEMVCMGSPSEGELELEVGSGQIAVSVYASTTSEYGDIEIAFGGAAVEQ